eukprot:COSAG02_NODE_45178_length_359_cov_1.142308_1_plen_37_part_10
MNSEPVGEKGEAVLLLGVGRSVLLCWNAVGPSLGTLP